MFSTASSMRQLKDLLPHGFTCATVIALIPGWLASIPATQTHVQN